MGRGDRVQSTRRWGLGQSWTAMKRKRRQSRRVKVHVFPADDCTCFGYSTYIHDSGQRHGAIPKAKALKSTNLEGERAHHCPGERTDKTNEQRTWRLPSARPTITRPKPLGSPQGDIPRGRGIAPPARPSTPRWSRLSSCANPCCRCLAPSWCPRPPCRACARFCPPPFPPRLQSCPSN